MTDYTKIVDYAIKDTLAPGTPEKRVRGTELDAEFEAIEAASTTKIDDDQKNTAGGVAGLTSAGLLPPAIIPDYADIQSLIGLLGDGIAVLTGALQANLNADQLDSQEGAYYLDLANATGALPTPIVAALLASLLPENANISYINVDESHTGGKATTTVAIDSTVNSVISPDTTTSNVFKTTLTQNCTLAVNAGDKDGQVITLIVQQDPTGAWTLTPDAAFKGTVALNVNPDEVTVITYVVDGGVRYITSIDIGSIV